MELPTFTESVFLHAANKPFDLNEVEDDGQVHITNCCANSCNPELFAGEISIDFLDPTFCEYEKKGADDAAATVPEFGVDDWDYTGAFPSISKCVADMAAALAPFSRGGERNGCFEFIGLDFIVTWEDRGKKQVAWLLECNAPPGQGTASGLSHAEDLHNEVHRDIITAGYFRKYQTARYLPSYADTYP